MLCVVVLVGLPGSGKSTLARVFEEAGWVVVNQDSLGDRKRCEAAAAAALAAGHSCVIDRCNHNAMQRRHWVDIARRHAQHTRTAVTLVALVLELPPELCLERACGRGDAHATLPASEAAAASERFKTEWQWPQRREGFDTVLAARSSEQATTLARALATQLPAAAQPAAAAVEPAVPAAPGGPGQAQQWRQVSSSRSDGDWRRPADGEGGQPPPSPQRSQHPGHGSLPASPARRGEGSSNAVPFPGRRQHGHMQQPHHPAHDNPHRPRRHPWSRHEYDEPSGVLLDNEPTAKPILLFDANGVLTSHTSMRRSTGLHLARPGTPHLRRLQDHFHIGMFSSASQKTVDTALALLEEAAGPAPHRLFDRRFVLHRSHTFLAPLAHVARSGKEWDTVKPLKPYFSRLHRVILVDDDSHKSVAGEERNMLLMPVWEGHDGSDTMVEALVQVLLQLAEALEGDPEADMRDFTADATAQLAALAAEARAARQLAAVEAEVDAVDLAKVEAEAEAAEAEMQEESAPAVPAACT